MTGPLEGFRVLDLSQIVSGPFASLLLSDQGADVVKVEPVDGQDVTRRQNFARGGLSAFYMNGNRGKRSISVDLTVDDGRQILLDLASTADVFIQNFRPGACDRLGLGYKHVRAVNPDVVYVSISGYGPDGPYANRPVLDPVIQGLTGMVAYQVNPDIPFPDLVRNIVSDKSTALTTAQAVTAALLARERGAGGQHVEVPMLDSTLAFFWNDGMVDLTLVGDGVSPGQTLAEVYRLTDCVDGKIIYFAASTAHIHGVCRAVGHPEWCEDPRYSLEGFVEDQANQQLFGVMTVEAFATMTTTEALEGLEEADVPCGPILEKADVLAHPQVTHNGSVVTWEHPTAGTVRSARPGARFSATPVEMRLNAAWRGADNREILRELGRSEEEIDALLAAGVIGEPDPTGGLRG
ncbi:MAG: CaiB/BaiF CoA-transferase family protein [Acidimicrobiales bacterium]|nr:CaiB/BaiF CoA-transferase family protein [Acidimicrobiales bacterium]